jgi:transposase
MYLETDDRFELLTENEQKPSCHENSRRRSRIHRDVLALIVCTAVEIASGPGIPTNMWM